MNKLIVFGILTVVFIAMWLMPHRMLSPGELVQGHQKLNDNCLSCHIPLKGISGEKCISCHQLSDIGKNKMGVTLSDTTKKKVLFHQNLSSQSCISCHTDHIGLVQKQSFTRFDHKLLSGIDNLNCNSCHQKPEGKLHAQLSTECVSCHNENGWKSNIIFNHDKIEGIDKKNCTLCHQAPKDNNHQAINANCGICHSSNRWLPSTFNHSSYFLLDENHNAKCVTCHTSNDFGVYTCYSCHEHSENKIAQEHAEEGIVNFTQCISCHKSGSEHDIQYNGNDSKLNQSEIKNAKSLFRSNEEKVEDDD